MTLPRRRFYGTRFYLYHPHVRLLSIFRIGTRQRFVVAVAMATALVLALGILGWGGTWLKGSVTYVRDPVTGIVGFDFAAFESACYAEGGHFIVSKACTDTQPPSVLTYDFRAEPQRTPAAICAFFPAGMSSTTSEIAAASLHVQNLLATFKDGNSAILQEYASGWVDNWASGTQGALTCTAESTCGWGAALRATKAVEYHYASYDLSGKFGPTTPFTGTCKSPTRNQKSGQVCYEAMGCLSRKGTAYACTLQGYNAMCGADPCQTEWNTLSPTDQTACCVNAGGVKPNDGWYGQCCTKDSLYCPHSCGNATKEFTEACDDGNAADGDGCSSSCTVEAEFECTNDSPMTASVCSPLCGNGSSDPGEECDDGNAIDTDACTNECKNAVCGDSIVQGEVEECDDGNTRNSDSCSSECKNIVCGDGEVTAGSGEQCDDGNTVDTDECSNDCKAAFCGDGIEKADGTEECDDGNNEWGDGCGEVCTQECKDEVRTADFDNPSLLVQNSEHTLTYAGIIVTGGGPRVEDGTLTNSEGLFTVEPGKAGLHCFSMHINGNANISVLTSDGESTFPVSQTTGDVEFCHTDSASGGNDAIILLNVDPQGVTAFDDISFFDYGECATASSSSSCTAAGDQCQENAQCCTGRCDVEVADDETGDPILLCNTHGPCKSEGQPCSESADCCSQTCSATQSGSVNVHTCFAEAPDTGGSTSSSVPPPDTSGGATGGNPGGTTAGSTAGGPGSTAGTTSGGTAGDGSTGGTPPPPSTPPPTAPPPSPPTMPSSSRPASSTSSSSLRASSSSSSIRASSSSSSSSRSTSLRSSSSSSIPWSSSSSTSSARTSSSSIFSTSSARSSATSSSSSSVGFCCVNNGCSQRTGCTETMSQCSSHCSSLPPTPPPPSSRSSSVSSAATSSFGFCCTTGDQCIQRSGCTLSPAECLASCGLHSSTIPPPPPAVVQQPPQSSKPIVVASIICGNGIVEAGEECDDKNTRDRDGCSAQCRRETGLCGDGIVQSALGEQCDDGNRVPNDDCSNACKWNPLPECGDGILQPDVELCDRGRLNSDAPNSQCRTNCIVARCGDGVVDTLTEACDDGNNLSGDGCSSLCVTENRAAPVQASVIPPPREPYRVKNIPTPARTPTGPGLVIFVASGAAAGVGIVRRRFIR